MSKASDALRDAAAALGLPRCERVEVTPFWVKQFRMSEKIQKEADGGEQEELVRQGLSEDAAKKVVEGRRTRVEVTP